jgi:hypothetical protein
MNRHIITISVLVLAGIACLIHFTCYEPQMGTEIETATLEADKSKILQSKEVDWIEDVLDEKGKPTGEIINKGKIMSYDYISDRKVEGKFLWDEDNYTNAKILGEKGNTKTVAFYSGDHFYKDGEDVYEIEHGATTTIETFEEATKTSWLDKLLGRDVLATDYYTGAGDGRVGYFVAGESWGTAHDAETGTTADYTTDVMTLTETYKDIASTHNGIWRGFLPIDTSGLPTGAIISEALLKLYVTFSNNSDADGEDWANVVQTSQDDNTELITADYNQCGDVDSPDEGATRISLNGMGTGWKTWTLNSTGRGWINDDGYTLLGMREGHDVLNHQLSVNGSNKINIRYSEYTGTDSDPYLSVTYTEPVAEEEEYIRNIIIFE